MSEHLYPITIPAGEMVMKEIFFEPGHDTYFVSVHTGEGSTARIMIRADAIAGMLYITTKLAPGSRIFIGVCARISGSSNLKINSFQWHDVPHAESRVWVRKIVSDEAVATYQGLIRVAEGAVGTIVSQDDKTLLDGTKARAESQPILEVLTNEVSCSHGSALGRVDPQMVWYMQTRGIAVDAARALLYQAFFDEVRAHVLSEG